MDNVRTPLAQAEYPDLSSPNPRTASLEAAVENPRSAVLKVEDVQIEPVKVKPLTYFELLMRRNSALPASCQAPDSLMVLNGALFFDELPSRDSVVALVQNEMLFFTRFRSIVAETGAIEPCEVDLAYHIQVLDDEQTVSETPEVAIARIGKQPLDPARPLWQMLLVPHRERPYVVSRVHHCLGDGFALASVFERVLKTESGEPIPSFAGSTKAPVQEYKAPGKRAKCARAVVKTCRGVAVGCDAVASFFKNAYIPKARFETDHAFSPLKHKKDGLVYSGTREVMFFPKTSLRFVKQLKEASHSTVNDVTMACFAGAVRAYCLAVADDQAFEQTKAPLLRALVPFGMPIPAVHPDDLHNNFAFLSVPMSAGPRDEKSPFGPVEARVKQTQKTMNKFKRSTLPLVSLWTVNKVSHKLPVKEQQKIGMGLFARHSVVYSNVPGPQQAVYFAGQRLRDIQVVFLNHIPQVILLSYDGQVSMNLCYDPDVITRPDLFRELYQAQFVALAEELGVSSDGVFS